MFAFMEWVLGARGVSPSRWRFRILNVGYIVHDLADPAVGRRLKMLRRGGAAVELVGFRRGPQQIAVVAGSSAREIGRTHDARFLDRLAAILIAALFVPRWIGGLRDADVIIARNLETLALARLVRALSTRRPILVYEVLDIHRLLLESGWVGQVFRWAERQLARPVDRLVVSSPAFLASYYTPRGQVNAPAILVENKVLTEPDVAPSRLQRPAAPPWRIGWFGMIRCNRSLKLLKTLCEVLPGRVEVDIRGRVAATEIPDILGEIRSIPGMLFLGPYEPPELASAYGTVHFVWAVDFFEAHANSNWLLPNRLYEGQFYGAVPIAQAGVETGRWLAHHEAGVRLDDVEVELRAFFEGVDEPTYQMLVQAVEAIPRSALACGLAGCRDLVDALRPTR